MKLRIIAGHYGGRLIETPRNSRRTHPMGDRVRLALFNIIDNRLQSASVLDLFAGSGALGFEALSRGATNVTFVEKDRTAQMVIQQNIWTLDVDNSTTVIKTTVSNWLNTYDGDGFDIIFADPPYHDLQLSTVLRAQGLLKPNGLMVLSHTGKSEVPVQNEIVVVDNRSYGNAYLTFYRRVTSASMAE